LESIPPSGNFTSEISFDRLQALWLDRVNNRRPVQYLAGKTPWRDFELVVTPDVLIPRPETEMTIDIAQTESGPSQRAGNWVDLGTGSGAIAIGLARKMPQARIFAVDTSAAALAVARSNAERLGALDRISFHHGNWWQPLSHLQGRVDGMVSNPPYIPSATVLTLAPEVVAHEPHLALDGGADGLEAIVHLVETAPNYLKPDGLWLVEHMSGQSSSIMELLARNGNYTDIRSIHDLAGLDRFVVARRRAD
jgi:release factor glutamine methyltransferase